jgi:hypothetical protein
MMYIPITPVGTHARTYEHSSTIIIMEVTVQVPVPVWGEGIGKRVCCCWGEGMGGAA